MSSSAGFSSVSPFSSFPPSSFYDFPRQSFASIQLLFPNFFNFFRVPRSHWPQRELGGGLQVESHVGLQGSHQVAGGRVGKPMEIFREVLDDLMKNFVDSAKAGRHGDEVKVF